MPSPCRRLPAACAALLLPSALSAQAGLGSLPAKESRPGAPGQPARAPGGTVSKTPEGLLWIEFPGGTAEVLVGLLGQAVEETASFVADGNLAAVKLPQMVLKNVSLETALRVLQSAAKVNGELVIQTIQEESGSPVYFLRFESPTSPPGEGSPGLEGTGMRGGAPAVSLVVPVEPVRSQVISLARMTRGIWGEISADERAKRENALLEDVMKIASETYAFEAQEAPGFKEPRVSFHRDSSLLLVRGTDRQIDFLRSLVAEIAAGQDPQASPASLAARDETLRLRAQVEQLSRQVLDLTALVNRLTASKKSAPAEGGDTQAGR